MPAGIDYSSALNGLVIVSSASLALTHHFDTYYQESHVKAQRKLTDRFGAFSKLVDDGHKVHEERRQEYDNLTATSISSLRYLRAAIFGVLIVTSLLMSLEHCSYVVALLRGLWLPIVIAGLAFIISATLTWAAMRFWSTGQLIRRIDKAVLEFDRDIRTLTAARAPGGHRG